VELTGAFDIGPMRTLQQDVEFGVIQIVDIALRAISPAVNDPSTAISCIDQLSRILIRWIGRFPPESHLYKPPNVLRVVLPWIDLDGMLDTAIEQIRAYATNDAPVSLRLLRLLHDVAVTVENDVMRLRIVERGAVRRKSSTFDLVTDADEAAEVAITAALKLAFPDSVVIGEESTHREPALLQTIADAELAFIVDPIDGTKNFASSLPLFGVMAAVTIRGEIIAGVIHDPVCRDWAYAVRGGGAWAEQEDATRIALRVADPVPVSEMEGFIGTTYLPEPLRTTVNTNLSRLATTASLRCAAHEYRVAAAGHCHLLFYNRLMPWDHAAGWLLHHEAGGYSAHFDGATYHPTHFSGGLIYAPDEASWHLARAALLGQ
jgi:fructose-1,6-bisphosphatase/inositol monophosphatase family enzyme